MNALTQEENEKMGIFIERFWVKPVSELYPNTPVDIIRRYGRHLRVSQDREHKRITRMCVAKLELADDKLKNAKSHLKAVSSIRGERFNNWRLYISIIALEEMVKAHLILQGRPVKGHDYLSPLVTTLRKGRAKRQIKALEDFAHTVGIPLDVNTGIDKFLSEIEKIRQSPDKFATASAQDIGELLDTLCEIRKIFSSHMRDGRLTARMRTQIPAMADFLSNGETHTRREIEFAMRTLIDKVSNYWPVELDMLLLGAVLDAHRNRTRYVDERGGYVRPDRYDRESPLGVVKRRRDLIELMESIRDRVSQEVQNIKETKSYSDFME